MDRRLSKFLRPMLAAWLLTLSGLSMAQGQDVRPSTNPSVVVGPSKEEYKARRKSLMEKIKEAEAGTGLPATSP